MDPKTDTPTEGEQKMQNIREEYKAICEKLKTLPSFRFTLIGLYVAAVGVVLSGEPDPITFGGIILLTACLWIIDLRTRALLSNVRKRGIYIEKHYWGYNAEKEKEPYLHHMRTMEKKRLKVKFFGSKGSFPAWFSHSLGIDLLFLLVILYSVVQFLILTFRQILCSPIELVCVL